MEEHIAAVILAAGDGKRMKSHRAKVCCDVLMKPMLSWVLDACAQSGIARENTCVVLSDHPTGVPTLIPEGVATAVQRERRGTGHAVRSALDFLESARKRGISDVAVLCGDAPLLSAKTLTAARCQHRESHALVTVISAELDHPDRYGRMIRENGVFSRIVEASDADPAQLLVREVNAGAYWFQLDYLIAALPLLTDQNAQGEWYLTDLVGFVGRFGGTAGAFVCSASVEAMGANTRSELAALNRAARQLEIARLHDAGVDVPLEDGVMIGPDVTVGADTVILPGTILQGHVAIGADCRIGPNTTVIDCTIGDGCVIDSSRLCESTVGNGVRIGPFAQLRPGSVLADRVKIGNFVEVKNSAIGEATSLAHLTYVGDSDFGARINVGCGVVTVNYDGRNKYRTTVGDDAFIGCNTNLIAPVTVGAGAYVAAASTLTENIAPDALAIGRVRAIQKENWASTRRQPLQNR